jgi:cytochrome b involved in lipid metabolism
VVVVLFARVFLVEEKRGGTISRRDSSKMAKTKNESSSSKSSSKEEIGFAELCRHNKVDDLWLAIDGIVYDVTPFMDDHPGGGDIMLSAAGKDGTDDFEDVGHSPHARELLKRFKVGTFKGDFSSSNNGASLTPKQQRKQNTTTTTTHAQMDTIGGNAIVGLVLPVLVIACAIAAYYLGFNDAAA